MGSFGSCDSVLQCDVTVIFDSVLQCDVTVIWDAVGMINCSTVCVWYVCDCVVEVWFR